MSQVFVFVLGLLSLLPHLSESYTCWNCHNTNGCNAQQQLLNTLLKRVESNTRDIKKTLDLLESLNASLAQPATPSSCNNIASGTGYYKLYTPSGLKNVMCHMDTLCGIDGPWTRVGYLNMSSTSQTCPLGFREYNESGIRGCGRPLNSTIPSVFFDTFGMSYSRVCGRVSAYRWKTTDSFDSNVQKESLDNAYVDGVSITRGYPRQHVWSFASGWEKSSCPCHTSTAKYRQPSFVGQDYFCEVVSGGTYSKGLYSELMWDGVGCSASTCCHGSSTMPWFKNELSVSSTDVLELRAVCDSNFGDEDIVIASYAIYVQ